MSSESRVDARPRWPEYPRCMGPSRSRWAWVAKPPLDPGFLRLRQARNGVHHVVDHPDHSGHRRAGALHLQPDARPPERPLNGLAAQKPVRPGRFAPVAERVRPPMRPGRTHPYPGVADDTRAGTEVPARSHAHGRCLCSSMASVTASWTAAPGRAAPASAPRDSPKCVIRHQAGT